MSDASRHVADVASAVASGDEVNWSDALSLAHSSHERSRIDQLKRIADLRGRSARPEVRPALGAINRLWTLLLGLAWLQIFVAMAGLPFLGGAGVSRFLPAQIFIMVAFVLAAVILLVGGEHDTRARRLADLYVLIAAAYARPLYKAAAFDGDISWLAPLWNGFYPEAFLGAAAWRFARVFPSAVRFGLFDRTAGVMIGIATGAGIVLFAVGIAQHPSLSISQVRWVLQFHREDPSARFWHVTYVLIFTALAAIPIRGSAVAGAERRRLVWFGLALVLGAAPLISGSVLEIISPGFRALKAAGGLSRAFIDSIVIAGLMSEPLTTSYIVLVHRVLAVRMVFGRLLRYALLRQTLLALVMLPLLLIGVYAYRHRQQPLGQVLGAADILRAAGLSGLAAIALAARQRFGVTLDRSLQNPRERHAEQVTQMAKVISRTRTPREIALRVSEQLSSALGIAQVALFGKQANGDFWPMSGTAPVLPSSSALAAILSSANDPLIVDPASPLLRILPDTDRSWLRRSQFEVLVPLSSKATSLAGILAAGPSLEGLPPSREDIALLSATAATVCLALEQYNIEPELAEEVAQECVACGLVLDSPTPCPCGGPRQLARLPLTIGGKFRVLRRLGSGGMGVVYLAHDDRLQRLVAVKTLPDVSGTASQAMFLEAQVMAATDHSNLAFVFGLEVWRSTPVLIVEYMAGGTLSDRLAKGPLPVNASLQLAADLADALAALHRDNTLHRDIKPSNIGFTRIDVPKLLDFGLAQLMQPATSSASRRLDVTAIAGTPLYLSPETLAGQPMDEYVDLWALSLVLFECLAGVHPFATAQSVEDVSERIRKTDLSIRRWQPNVPSSIDRFLRSALSLDRSDRPTTAKELTIELRRLQTLAS